MVSGGRGCAGAAIGGGAGTAGGVPMGAGAGDAVGGGAAVAGAAMPGAGCVAGGMVSDGGAAGIVAPGVGAMVLPGAAGAGAAGAGLASTTGACAWLAAGNSASSAITPALSAITRRLTRERRARRASTSSSERVGANGGCCGIVASLGELRNQMPRRTPRDHSGSLFFILGPKGGRQCRVWSYIRVSRRRIVARRRRASDFAGAGRKTALPARKGPLIACDPGGRIISGLLAAWAPTASAPRPPPGRRPAGTCPNRCCGSGP